MSLDIKPRNGMIACFSMLLRCFPSRSQVVERKVSFQRCHVLTVNDLCLLVCLRRRWFDNSMITLKSGLETYSNVHDSQLSWY